MYSDIFESNKLIANPVVLAIFAHPDDETINCGGVLVKASSMKINTHVLCFTLGGLGTKLLQDTSNRLEKIRGCELRCAAEILRIKKLHLPRLPDGHLYFLRPTLKQVILKTITAVKPSIIITHDPTGLSGHPDHISISMCIAQIFSSGKFRDIDYYYSISNRTIKKSGLKPTHKVDIFPYLSTKFHALHSYESQILPNNKHADTVFRLETIGTELFHRLHNNSYVFHFRQFQTDQKILLPGINKKYTVYSQI
jgi:LmbE family N-acetylglucosaminyl deacetylase